MAPWNKKSKKQTQCEQDPQTGQVYCEMNRVTEDGNQESLASVNFQFDANCQPVASGMKEGEEGHIDQLMSKVTPHLASKCKSKPSDY